MSVARWALVAFLGVLLGCVRAAAPERQPEEDLGGLTAPLRGEPTLRLLLAGTVLGKPAQVELELAAPLSAITAGCFDTPPEAKGTVRVQGMTGALEALPEVILPRAVVEGRALSPRPVAVISGSECRLVLGSDVLASYALHFDPERWLVSIGPSRSRETYDRLVADEGHELYLLALTKDPSTDRLLVPVQLQAADGRQLTSTFILATSRPRSGLGTSPARMAGIELDATVAQRLPMPVVAARQLKGLATYSLEGLQLAPELSLERPTLDGLTPWAQPSAVGILGGDVWGRFKTTIDPGAQVMVLRRPRMHGDVRRRTCGPPTTTDEESCFSIQSEALPESGLRVTTTVWRDLPSGGRIYLEALDAQGKSLRAPCQLGINLPPSDRGSGVAQVFPWSTLIKAFPTCGEALRTATSVRPLLFEEEVDPQCSGQCAFAMHPRGRGVVCSCAVAPGDGAPGATERNLQLFRRFREQELRRVAPPLLPQEQEPDESELEEEAPEGRWLLRNGGGTPRPDPLRDR